MGGRLSGSSTQAGGAVPPGSVAVRSGGRPLDQSRADALRLAALELVAEIGYDRLTIDAVAARARAGKATVYRRWPSKAELVVDAFVRDAFAGLPTPDTGSLRADLLALSEHMWMRSSPVPRASVMAGMMSALLANPELRDAFNAASRPPESIVGAVLTRAVARGEIPEPEDLDALGAVMPSMCMFHLVKTGAPPNREFFERVVDRIILPALQYRPPNPSREGD
jgi:AcrR family transcriptional regulator